MDGFSTEVRLSLEETARQVKVAPGILEIIAKQFGSKIPGAVCEDGHWLFNPELLADWLHDYG